MDHLNEYVIKKSKNHWLLQFITTINVFNNGPSEDDVELQKVISH